MWDIRRRILVDRLPDRPVVVQFHFRDAPKGQRDFWLVLNGREVDLCLQEPGYDVDLWVEADLLALTRVWVGDIAFSEATRHGAIELTGPARLRRAFPGWLGLGARSNANPAAAR